VATSRRRLKKKTQDNLALVSTARAGMVYKDTISVSKESKSNEIYLED
jgi:hypothetical protein